MITWQEQLPEAFKAMKAHGVKYNWMLACSRDGGRNPHLSPRMVKTAWKPILWYVRDRCDGPFHKDLIGLIDASEQKDAEHSPSPQSSIEELITHYSAPTSTVCDPFLSDGAMPVIAIKLGRRFIGCSTDVERSKGVQDSVLNANCQIYWD